MKNINTRQGRPQAKGYSEAGASTTRRALKGFVPLSGSPNEDINWNNATLRQRGRMLYMSSPVATAAINTNRTKVIGTGLTLKCVIDRNLLGMTAEAAKLWQRTTEAEFKLWSEKKQNCDAIGVNNFSSLQQLALKSWLMNGDVFALIRQYSPTRSSPYSVRVHLIEADRVSTPTYASTIGAYPLVTDGRNRITKNKIYDGVEIDNNGMIVAYHIRSTYPYQVVSTPTVWTRIEAYGKNTGLANILHIMDSERCDQYRGVTYLAPVIEMLLQLRRYTESEIMAALVQSYFTAWIITKEDASDNPLNEVGSGEVHGLLGEESDEISDSENEYEMGPGIVNVLNEGEDIKFGSPNIPTAGFEAFVKTVSRLIGAALEIPYDVLLKEFNSSYSAARGALLEAWEAFKMRRKWFVDDFCQPIYEIWLAEAVARGRIKAPSFFDDPRVRAAWCGARWIGPVQGQLDPVKEAKASVINVNHGFKTHEQVTREAGGSDWEENAEQLALENEKLQAAGGGTYAVPVDGVGDDEDEKGGNKS